jgi:hypothetical protein
VCCLAGASAGKHGLWVGENGSVQVASQEPGGHWTTWSEFKKPTDPPSDIIALAAAQDVNGYAQLWALTRDHVLHSRYESSVGNWTDWSDPKVGWFPSPKLTQICVCSPGGVPRGRQIWGVGQGGGLYTTYEDSSQKGGWVPWFQRAKWKWNGPPRTIIALATEIAGNGCRSLWALSSDHVLHYIHESSVGHWNDWSDFTIGGLPEIRPKFTQICACRTPWGLQFWAVDDGGGWHSTHETSGHWVDWADWKGPAGIVIVALTAAQQRNGRVSLWALGTDHLLHHQSHTDDFGHWSEWAAF